MKKGRPVLSSIVFLVGAGLSVVGVAVVGSLIVFGRSVPWTYLMQGHSTVKLIPSVLVFLVSSICVISFLRYLLENIEVVEPSDKWRDWRDDELTTSAAPDEAQREENSSSGGTLHDATPWTHRGRLRSRRMGRPKKHWGYNNH